MKELILKAKKEIKLKNGNKYPIGTKCKIEPMKSELGTYYAKVTILDNDVTTCFNTVYGNLYRYFSKFHKEPSMNTLMMQSADGVCTTPIGCKVELDGTDSYGFPSWFMVLGLV